MQDPLPENIQGRKVHVVEHEIQWGYLVWGVVALLLLWVLFGRNGSEESADDVEAFDTR